jgi:hypothetical protein
MAVRRAISRMERLNAGEISISKSRIYYLKEKKKKSLA